MGNFNLCECSFSARVRVRVMGVICLFGQQPIFQAITPPPGQSAAAVGAQSSGVRSCNVMCQRVLLRVDGIQRHRINMVS